MKGLSKIKISLSAIVLLILSLVVLGGTDDTIVAKKQMYLIGIFLLYALYSQYKFGNKIKTRLFQVYVPLLLIQLIGLVYSLDRRLTERYIVFFFIYVMCLECRLLEEHYLKLIKCIRYLSLILGLSIIASALLRERFVQAFSFWLTNQDRVLLDIRYGQFSGLVGDRAFAAMAMYVGIAALMSCFLAEKKIKFTDILELMILLIGVLLTGKRIVFLMLLGCLLCLMFVLGSSRTRKTLGRTIFVGGVLVVLAYIFVPATRILFQRFFSMIGDTTYNGRTAFWGTAFSMINQKPLLGWGMGSFVEYNKLYGTGIRQYAHNMYIEFAAEMGIIGLLLMLALFALYFVTTVRLIRFNSKRSYDALLLFSLFAQVGFLIYGLTGYPYYNLHQGVLYFVACGMVSMVDKNLECKGSNDLDEEKPIDAELEGSASK